MTQMMIGEKEETEEKDQMTHKRFNYIYLNINKNKYN